jgi:hypothetical protein
MEREKSKATEMKRIPQTPQEWHAYRATLSCQIGIDAINNRSEVPKGVTVTEWAIYNLLQAVDSLAKIHLPEETK